MNNDLNQAASVLNKGQLQRIEDGQGSRVLCISGCLWLTQQGSPRDIVLNAGDEATLSHDGTTIVMALSDSRWLHAEAPTGAAPAKAHGKRLTALTAGMRRALWLA
jgi:hypothetical protein